MEELRQFFGEDGKSAITFEQFSEALAASGMKLADISKSRYVEKEKFDKLQKKFDEYKEAYSPEKYSDYDSVKSELEKLRGIMQDNEYLAKIGSAKVTPKFQKFVLSEVKQLTSESKNFETVLAEYLKENSQFVEDGGQQPKVFTRSSSNPLSGGSADDVQTTSEKMNKAIRQAFRS